MLIKLFQGAAAKKTALLAAAFALLCAVLGNELRSRQPVIAGQAAAPPTASAASSEGIAVSSAASSVPSAFVAIRSGGEYPAIEEEPAFAREPAPESGADAAPVSLPVGFLYSEEIPLPYELQDYTYRRCVDRGLEYELILALMWRESGFRLDAVGYNSNGTRDNGVMQINDVNKGWLEEQHGITDLMDPYQNIDAGTLILGGFTRKYGTEGALMAYQYGEEGMKRKRAEGVFTNDLIARLFTKREELRELLGK